MPSGQTPGQRLMGICFANVTRFKALAHYFLAIILPNALEIAKSFSLQRSRHHWWTLFNRISVALKLADLLYFLYFLSAGGPSRMVEKLLRLRSVYAGNKKPGIGMNFFQCFIAFICKLISAFLEFEADTII